MPSYPEIQEGFSAGLGTGAAVPLDVASPRAPDEAARRFAVYRNNVRVGLGNALRRRFPVVARLVGDSFAAGLFAAYQDVHLPNSPLMMRYGDRMPEFIESFQPAAALPYLADIARLELARGRAYHAADAPPVAQSELAAAASRDPEDLRPRVHPSVEVVVSPHPIAAIWSMNQPGATPAPIARWRGESVLVARSGLDLVTVAIPQAEGAFIAALAEANASLSDAAGAAAAQDLAFEPAAVLARLLRSSLVTGFD